MGGKVESNEMVQTYTDENLTYKIFLSENKDFVIVDYHGVVDRKTGLEVAIAAQVFGRKHNINKCLLDLRGCVNKESIIDNYEFAYNDTGKSPNIDKAICIVMLVDAKDHSHDFIETVSRNNGFNMTLFRDETQAIDFLLKS